MDENIQTPVAVGLPLQSEAQDKIIPALIKFQGSISTVAKSKDNPYFSSKYADLGAIFEVIRKPLADNGLCVTQEPLETAGDLVRLKTTVFHESGQFRSSILAIRPTKADPQGVGSAITYARRYGLSPMLGIVTEEDDDGNAASGNASGNGKGQQGGGKPPQSGGKTQTPPRAQGGQKTEKPKDEPAKPAPAGNGKSELAIRKEGIWHKLHDFLKGDDLATKKTLQAKINKPSKDWTTEDVVQLEGYVQDIVDGIIVIDSPEEAGGGL